MQFDCVWVYVSSGGDQSRWYLLAGTDSSNHRLGVTGMAGCVWAPLFCYRSNQFLSIVWNVASIIHDMSSSNYLKTGNMKVSSNVCSRFPVKTLKKKQNINGASYQSAAANFAWILLLPLHQKTKTFQLWECFPLSLLILPTCPEVRLKNSWWGRQT